MSRLTDFKHDIVCDIGKQVNASHSAVIKADSHIERALVLGYIIHLDAGISVNKVFSADGNINLFIAVIGEIAQLKRFKLSACKGGKLSCDSVVTPKVGAVGEGFIINFKNYIVNGID